MIAWIFRCARGDALRACREFLEYHELLDSSASGWHGRTPHLAIGRFARWAEGRKPPLEGTTAADAAAYAREIAARKSEAARIGLAALRALFRHLASAGVIDDIPFEQFELGSTTVVLCCLT
jgi:hypothetical protein